MTLHELSQVFKDYKEIIEAVLAFGAVYVGFRKNIHGRLWSWAKNIRDIWMTPKLLRDQMMSEIKTLNSAVQGIAQAQSVFASEILGRIGSIENTVNDVKYMVYPNGGSSLSDQISILTSRVSSSESEELIIYTNANGECSSASRKFLKLTGRMVEDVEGWGWTNTIEETDRPSVIRDFRECIREGIDYEDTFEIITDQKQMIEVHCLAQRVKGASGKIIGYRIKLTLTN